MTVKVSVAAPPEHFDLEVETLIIGAGACGLVAALSAHEVGQSVLVIEADAVPSGSTALSAGLIPAAGTKIQRATGIDDSAEIFAQDIQAKAHGENDQVLVDLLANGAAEVIDWLGETHGLPFSLVSDFDYPGHSARRMHGLPTRSGAELIDALRNACETQGIDIICQRRASTLFYEGEQIEGISAIRPDGGVETIGCERLILACNGFGGNRGLVSEHIPQIKDAVWFGHDGNRGEAVLWAEGIGARTRHLASYQGHGNVAHPHGILITWAVITEGGFQVNRLGERFWNEAQGYSEAARAVMSQPEGEAFAIFDARIAGIARQFEDFKRAEAIGAIHKSDTLTGLGIALGLPEDQLERTADGITLGGTDAFGREFGETGLAAPFYGVRVTGALFHTQGGLVINEQAQVLRENGGVFPNLYAGGGAGCGVSGRSDSGYLSGNGLLSAFVLGRRAGLEQIRALSEET
jgi:fumarate reductase flavoprotein subunit